MMWWTKVTMMIPRCGSRGTVKYYECPCGWAGWSNWGHARKHHEKCKQAQGFGADEQAMATRNAIDGGHRKSTLKKDNPFLSSWPTHREKKDA